MSDSPNLQARRILPLVWLALLGATGIYVGLTFVIPGSPKPQPPEAKVFLGILQVVAAVTFLAGMVVERVMLARAVEAQSVLVGGIVSAAIGESIAIYGLLVFFMTYERHWEFFAVSALYFLRLFIRLPDFNARFSQLER